MSFGWSAGDVIAGLKAVYDVWQAVSDGPLNAKYEASQFFSEFYHVVSRLEDWEKNKSACAKDDRLVRSHRELRNDCTEFIKKHFSLIQRANPETKAIRTGRTTWLQKAHFTRDQVIDLYRQVEWPTQRNTVAKLREKLRFFLELAAWDIALDTNRTVNQISSTHSELIATNNKIFASYRDLVQSVIPNLRRQTQGIDYPIPFERALHLPPPIEGGVNHNQPVPWLRGEMDDADQHAVIQSNNPANRDGGLLGQEEVRGLISQRLDNLLIRIKRTETMSSISELGSESQDTIQPPTQQLLDRLRVFRLQIGGAVGVADPMSQNEVPVVMTDPHNALRRELEAWDEMKERLEREILHPTPPLHRPPLSIPAVQRVWTIESTTQGEDLVSANPITTLPTAIPPRPNNLSPTSSYHGWTDPSSSRTPGSLSSSPNEKRMSTSSSERRMSSQSRSDSTSSLPRRLSIRSDHEFQVQLFYPQHPTIPIKTFIRTISKNDEGDVQTISTYSIDGVTRYRHAVGTESKNLSAETSMIPFVDNQHVLEGHPDQIPKLRVQFKGSHNLKVLRMENGREVTIATYACSPIYKFLNLSDFMQFQALLFDKEVKHLADVNIIRSYAGTVICRVGTVRVLFESSSRTRHILYFQHIHLPTAQKHGFMELPVSHFKPPSEPTRKTLTLDRQEAARLSSPRGSRFGFGRTGSVNTIVSNETSAEPTSAQIGGHSVRGLVLEFYDATACHKFWDEFTKIDPLPSP